VIGRCHPRSKETVAQLGRHVSPACRSPNS
jgi:hypothetical protein